MEQVQSTPNQGVTIAIVVIMIVAVLLGVSYILAYVYKKNKPPREISPFRVELTEQLLTPPNLDLIEGRQ